MFPTFDRLLRFALLMGMSASAIVLPLPASSTQLHIGIPTRLLPAQHPEPRQPDPVLGAADGGCL
jgi:hypothetical protein